LPEPGAEIPETSLVEEEASVIEPVAGISQPQPPALIPGVLSQSQAPAASDSSSEVDLLLSQGQESVNQEKTDIPTPLKRRRPPIFTGPHSDSAKRSISSSLSGKPRKEFS